jgi:N-acetylneuraminic acid mutarotase
MLRSAVVFLGAALLAGHPHATAPGASLIASLQPAPPAGTWTDVAALSIGRKYLAAAATADGSVFASGGSNSSGIALTLVEAYDPGSNTWSPVASLPEARYALASASPGNGLVYVMGGIVPPATYTAAVDAYNPSTNSWTAVASMGSRRIGLAATAAGGKIYVAGGYGSTGSAMNNVLATAEVYDPAANQWTPIASMTHARYMHALATGPDGRIYAIGGLDASNQRLASVEAYDPTTNQWTDVASLPSGRSDLAAVAGADGLIYVMGGMTSGGVQQTALAYDPKTDSWTDAPALSHARVDLAAAATPDGHVYAIGGTAYSGSDLNSVEAYGTAPKAAPPIAVTVTIKGGDNAPINRTAKGSLPVAVLSTSAFDATRIDRSTVVFAGAEALAIGEASSDLNGDGLPDAMFHFDIQALSLPDGTTQACMTGKTTDGKSFQGCDSIRLVK